MPREVAPITGSRLAAGVLSRAVARPAGRVLARAGATVTVSVAILLALVPTSAHARELWRDGHGGVLEGQAFYKNFVSAVWLQPSLVEGTEAFQSTLDASRALVPPEQAALLPQDVALPPFALLNAHILRLSTTFRFEDRLTFDVAWQVTASLSSDSSFSGGASLTGTIGGASGVRSAQRRLVELSSVLVDEPNLRIEQNLDRLALKLALPFGDLTVGRQVLSWGTGRLWNPTDVLSPFPPTVVDREVRRGFDAVRLAVAIDETTQLDLLYLPQPRPEDNGGVARLQANIKGWDASVSFGKYVSDLVIGADFVGDVGPVAVHGEGAYTLGLLGLSGGGVSVGEHFFRGVAGVDWRPHDKLLLMAEYHFNGYGADSPEGYAQKLSSSRVVRGEVFGAGRHYLGLAATWMQSEIFSATLSTLVNLADPSVLLVPALEYSFEQSVLVRAGGYVPLGARPDETVFASLTPEDVVTVSDALVTARRTLGLKSEYGSSTWGAFVQVGLYLP
ncbi:MAG: hypothetical protein AB1938_07140 [Myxococcota bacterium]